jgi:type II secretory pathway component PulJ
MHTDNRHGAVLLEALVALAVLGMVGGTAAWMVSECIRAVAHVHESEARFRAASRVLTAVSLWPRDDLDRHLGSRTQGPWRLRIDRPRPNLYDIALSEKATGTIVLRTALFRTEADR